MNPVQSLQYWFQNAFQYSCAVANVEPLRYDSRLQQAAKQFSFMLQKTCPFSHSSCEPYCSQLYNNSCDWVVRINTYQPQWKKSLGENIALSGNTKPLPPLGQLLRSAGHCKNIFNTVYNSVGIGNTEKYWVQDFAYLSFENPNPFFDGTHTSFENQDIVFYTNVYTKQFSIKNVVIVMNNRTTRAMSSIIGTNRSSSTYMYRLQKYRSPYCLNYYFQLETDKNQTFRLPEVGLFSTLHINNCTRNYIKYD
jgi:hypothetical protein